MLSSAPSILKPKASDTEPSGSDTAIASQSGKAADTLKALLTAFDGFAFYEEADHGVVGVVAADADLLAERARRVVASVVADGDLRRVARLDLLFRITGGGATAVGVDVEDEEGFIACVDELEVNRLYEVETESA